MHAQDADRLINRLETFPDALRAACHIVSEHDARWSPPDSPPTAHAPTWSIAQIALHLLLEERQDFRPRLLSTIADPAAPWTPIDPERAVAEEWGTRAAGPLSAILDDFTRERASSIEQLRALPLADAPIWSRTHHHPKIGPLNAGQLLACWAAHDALHLRQIAKRLHQITTRDAPGLDLSYAGSL